MKRARWIIPCLCGLLCLAGTGCGAPPPSKAADGGAWNDAWVSVGNVIGVDIPEGMTPRENSDALSAKGMYYATWSMGGAGTVVNEDGDEAQIYDAQVYLLLAGYDETAKAEDAAAQWLDMAAGQYAVESTASETYNGQAFTVITYTYTSETNPYAGGRPPSAPTGTTPSARSYPAGRTLTAAPRTFWRIFWSTVITRPERRAKPWDCFSRRTPILTRPSGRRAFTATASSCPCASGGGGGPAC